MDYNREKLDKILSKVGDFSFKRRVVEIIKHLDIQEGDKVLDIGCGEGFYPMVLSELFNCEVYSIDADGRILALAKKRLRNKKNVHLSKGTIYDLDFKKNFFDKIVCSEVLEHLANEGKALSEIHRVLKPEGTVVFTVPNKNYPFLWDPLNKIRTFLGYGHFNADSRYLGGVWSLGHLRLYSPTLLRRVLKKNKFEVETVKVFMKYCIPFNLLLLNIGKVFYTKLPVPKEIKTSMEKFDWKKPSKSIVLELPYKFLLWLDSFNDKKFKLKEPTVSILAKVTKK